MLATDMTGSGTPEEKLRWAFRMYDKDNSGKNNFSYFELVHLKKYSTEEYFRMYDFPLNTIECMT